MKLTISDNFPDVQRSLDALQSDLRGLVLTSAINRTLDLAKTRMIREITAEFNVKAGYVRERLRIRRASSKAGAFAIEGALMGGSSDRRRSANIIAFVTSSSLRGGQVFVKIKKGGPRKLLRGQYGTGAFIGNKGRTVFERDPGTTMPTRSKYSGTKHADKIVPIQVIDVAQMFNTRRINAKVVQVMLDRFPAVFEREAAFFTARFNRGGK